MVNFYLIVNNFKAYKKFNICSFALTQEQFLINNLHTFTLYVASDVFYLAFVYWFKKSLKKVPEPKNKGHSKF